MHNLMLLYLISAFIIIYKLFSSPFDNLYAIYIFYLLTFLFVRFLKIFTNSSLCTIQGLTKRLDHSNISRNMPRIEK